MKFCTYRPIFSPERAKVRHLVFGQHTPDHHLSIRPGQEFAQVRLFGHTDLCCLLSSPEMLCIRVRTRFSRSGEVSVCSGADGFRSLHFRSPFFADHIPRSLTGGSRTSSQYPYRFSGQDPIQYAQSELTLLVCTIQLIGVLIKDQGAQLLYDMFSYEIPYIRFYTRILGLR
jgi:hypothetical protein